MLHLAFEDDLLQEKDLLEDWWDGWEEVDEGQDIEGWFGKVGL